MEYCDLGLYNAHVVNIIALSILSSKKKTSAEQGGEVVKKRPVYLNGQF